MSILEGCMGKYRTPVPTERKCPYCGSTVEVFSRAGKQALDSTCPGCGYVLPAQPQPVFASDSQNPVF